MIKTLHQSTKILNRSNQIALIEQSGRTCYKSEHKISDKSSIKFIKNIIKAGHLSVLEHGSFCFHIHDIGLWKFLEKKKFINCTDNKFEKYASGNWRAFFEITQDSSYHATIIKKILNKLQPELFETDKKEINLDHHLTHIKTDTLNPEDRLIHHYISIRIVCDRGTSHEIVRHRNNLAISQESQRYVKYKDGIEFIIQIGIKDFSDRQSWIGSLVQANDAYLHLVKTGMKPEWARSVLPNATKTEMILTANIQEWKHILKLRCSKAAHPQINSLFEPLKKEII